MAIYDAPESLHVGNGVETVFGFNWPYLIPTDLRVTVNGVEVSVMLAAPNQVSVVPAPPALSVVRIYRNTPAQNPTYLFATGIPMLPKYIDGNNKQLLYALQEGLQEFDVVAATAERAETLAEQAVMTSDTALSRISRSIRVADTDPVPTPLPPVDGRAGKVLGFDMAGNPVGVLPMSGSGTEVALDLADPVTVGKGAYMVGYEGATVHAALQALEAEAAAARTVPTVAALQVLEGLVAGDVVRTAEYHAGVGTGAAVYAVQDTDPGWGIPLLGGKFAVLRDDFCVTKFGVRNTLGDQTAELRRMAAYADEYVYEIDFLGYRITVPDIAAYTSSRGTVFRGLTFYRLHKVKNLHLKNPTGVTLTQGWTCMQFIPKVAGTGLFELENVTFDPYSPTFSIISGEEDGAMCGFACRRWMNIPALRDCNYNFKYTNVHFKSPAISYNINTADVLSNNAEYNHMSGEYWGLYASHLAKDMQASEFHGWFRNDLHTGSGRVLVTSLIHDEAEIGVGSLVLGKWTVRDSSCRLFTTGAEHTVFKHHSVGSLEFQECHFTDIRGSVEFYSATASRVKELRVVRVSKPVIATIKFDSLYVESATLDPQTFNSPVPNQVLGTVEIRKSTVTALFGIGFPALTVAKLTLVGCRVDSPTEGIGRNGVTSIDTIQLTDCDLNSPYIIEAPFRTMRIDSCRTPAVAWANAIFNRNTTGNASVVVNNFIADATYGPSAAFLISGGVTQAVRLYHSVFKARPVIGGPSTLVEFGVYPPAT